MMPGAGRLGGRGLVVEAARIPVAVRVHPLILPFRLAAVVAAQLFDFGTFTIMVGRNGIGAELNPLVTQGFIDFGMPMLALIKVVHVILLASTIVVLDGLRPGRRSAPRLAALVTVLGVAAGLVGGISNAIAS